MRSPSVPSLAVPLHGVREGRGSPGALTSAEKQPYLASAYTAPLASWT